jgi:hypothetical protein
LFAGLVGSIIGPASLRDDIDGAFDRIVSLPRGWASIFL